MEKKASSASTQIRLTKEKAVLYLAQALFETTECVRIFPHVVVQN